MHNSKYSSLLSVKKNKVSMATQTDNMKDDWVTSDTEGGLVMSQNAAATASLGQVMFVFSVR